jgi:hypothetical protein
MGFRLCQKATARQIGATSEYRMVLYSFFSCGEVEVRLTGLLLSRSALKEYKVCFKCQVVIPRGWKVEGYQVIKTAKLNATAGRRFEPKRMTRFWGSDSLYAMQKLSLMIVALVISANPPWGRGQGTAIECAVTNRSLCGYDSIEDGGIG